MRRLLGGIAATVVFVAGPPTLLVALSHALGPWTLVYFSAAAWTAVAAFAVFDELVDGFVWGTWNHRRPWPRVHFSRWKRNNRRVVLWSWPFGRKIRAWSAR